MKCTLPICVLIRHNRETIKGGGADKASTSFCEQKEAKNFVLLRVAAPIAAVPPVQHTFFGFFKKNDRLPYFR